MFRIHLSKEEQTKITRALQTSSNQRLRNRYHALLMAHQGYKRQQIASDLAIGILNEKCHRMGERWRTCYGRVDAIH